MTNRHPIKGAGCLRRRKGFRLIHIDGVRWQWCWGRGMVVAYSEFGEKIATPLCKITVSYPVLPGAVAQWIRWHGCPVIPDTPTELKVKAILRYLKWTPSLRQILQG